MLVIRNKSAHFILGVVVTENSSYKTIMPMHCNIKQLTASEDLKLLIEQFMVLLFRHHPTERPLQGSLSESDCIHVLGSKTSINEPKNNRSKSKILNIITYTCY